MLTLKHAAKVKAIAIGLLAETFFVLIVTSVTSDGYRRKGTAASAIVALAR